MAPADVNAYILCDRAQNLFLFFPFWIQSPASELCVGKGENRLPVSLGEQRLQTKPPMSWRAEEEEPCKFAYTDGYVCSSGAAAESFECSDRKSGTLETTMINMDKTILV